MGWNPLVAGRDRNDHDQLSATMVEFVDRNNEAWPSPRLFMALRRVQCYNPDLATKRQNDRHLAVCSFVRVSRIPGSALFKLLCPCFGVVSEFRKTYVQSVEEILSLEDVESAAQDVPLGFPSLLRKTLKTLMVMNTKASYRHISILQMVVQYTRRLTNTLTTQ